VWIIALEAYEVPFFCFLWIYLIQPTSNFKMLSHMGLVFNFSYIPSSLLQYT